MPEKAGFISSRAFEPFASAKYFIWLISLITCFLPMLIWCIVAAIVYLIWKEPQIERVNTEIAQQRVAVDAALSAHANTEFQSFRQSVTSTTLK